MGTTIDVGETSHAEKAARVPQRAGRCRLRRVSSAGQEEAAKAPLANLRRRSRHRGSGQLEETLKWQQPSYLTPETKNGSTIRIDRIKSDPKRYAVYFHCQTNLVDSFKEMYGDTFTYEENRALHFTIENRIPEEELRQCIAMALTYHQKKRKSSI